MEKGKGFWTTLPGILTGVASLITAITGLWLIFYPGNGTPSPPPKPVPHDICEINVWNNWNIVKSHAGEITDAMDDVTMFLDVAAKFGCTGYTYTLQINKQNIGVYIVTLHEPYPNQGFKYRELSTTLEVGGERQPLVTFLYRSPMDRDDWDFVE